MIDIIYKLWSHHIWKMANHAKYKKPNVPSYLHIFWQNFDKANRRFFQLFLLFGETDFRTNANWGSQ